MSADNAAGTRLNCPPGDVTVTDDGQRVRAVWRPTRGVKRTALFRVATDDGVALLDHVRVVYSRRGTELSSDLDDGATLDDVPRSTLAIIRDLGFTPAVEEPVDTIPKACADCGELTRHVSRIGGLWTCETCAADEEVHG